MNGLRTAKKPGSASGPGSIEKRICDGVLELRNLSKMAGHTFLTQLLEMTYHEAFMLVNRVVPPKAELDETRRIIARAREWEASRRKAG